MSASRSALDWLELQFQTLYISDHLGRLQFIREPGYEESELDSAPRFLMGRSEQGNVWRFRQDLSADLTLELDALCRAEPVVANWHDEAWQATAIRAALQRHAPIIDEWRGPAYRIPETVHTLSNAVVVTEANADVLERYFAWKLTSRNSFRSATLAATVVDGDAVSMCYCARLTARAAEAGVETVEFARGRGYAVAAVNAWATAIRAGGLEPLYSTSWENTASQSVARKLEAVQYGEDWWIA